MVTLTVVGTRNAAALRLMQLAQRAVARVGSDAARLENMEVGPHDVINGISELPALFVDGYLISEGVTPKLRDVLSAIAKAQALSKRQDTNTHSPVSSSDSEVPHCIGCTRNCSLDAPGCSIGRAQAMELGL